MNPFRQINLLALQELTAKQKTIDKNKNNKIDGEDLAHLRKEQMRDTPVSKTQEEELVGKQHKIDKNKNGKVDAHDFKLLRKEEQIDELSKSTLGAYVKKSSRERGFSGLEAGASGVGSRDQKNAVKTMKKRQAGVIKAVDRLTKEAVQKVDIPAYLRKAKGDTPLKMSDLKRKDTISDKENLAKLRGVKEEAEQIDELDKKTLASYAYKAANQAADKTGEYEKRMNSADAAGARAKDGKLAFAKDANKAVQQHSVNKAKEARAVASKRLSGLNKAVSKLAFKEDKDKDEKEKDDKDDKYEDRISRSDYKVNASGRKSHKELVFGAKMKEETNLDEAKPGLYANINAKRKRIEAGSGERMRKPGSKGAPSASDFKDAAKTANENYDDNRRGFGKRPREDDEYHVPDPTVKKNKVSKMKKEEVQLDEASHREFASQGKMHPDMAKHMSVGSEHDYYEPKTGDKVSGKVIKKSATEVHMKQTHDSYDPKKTGTMHKFSISSKLDEGSAPFDGPYTKTKPVKNSDGTMQSPMSRARELAKQAMAKKKTNEETDLEEKIDMKQASMGDVIKDFKASDAPQFKGKSDEKRREMAVAAKLSAKQNEELHMHSFKSYIQEDMDESMFPGSPEYKAKFGNDATRGKVGSSKKTSMGTQTVTGTGVKHERDYDKAEKQSSAPVDQEKRGRGRPKGAASGARQKGSAVKSDDRYDSTGYKLHLPVKR